VPEAALRAWGSEPGMRFLGDVDDMPALLDTVDCVVLPSYYPEGVPRSLIEAAAAGKAIVTTRMPGCQEVVEPGANGWLLPPRDSEALLDALLQYAELDEEAQAALGAASRALAERRFDEALVIERYWQVLQRSAPAALQARGGMMFSARSVSVSDVYERRHSRWYEQLLLGVAFQLLVGLPWYC
ncbi:glycosyltransferase, partial [Halomonas sp. BC04]|uniref:glycosyltransferase n=1 Tax=Halomonas sp. BC04 TaxID=1403540 RepID=UPI0003ED72BE